MSYYAKATSPHGLDLYILKGGAASDSPFERREKFDSTWEALGAAAEWINKYHPHNKEQWTADYEPTRPTPAERYVAIVGYRYNLAPQEYFLTPYAFSTDIDKAVSVQPSEVDELEYRINRDHSSLELRRIVPESQAVLKTSLEHGAAAEAKTRLEQAVQEQDQADAQAKSRVIAGHGWILTELEHLLATIDEARSQLEDSGEYDQIRAVVNIAVANADRAFRRRASTLENR